MKVSACLGQEAMDPLALMSGYAYLHKHVLAACICTVQYKYCT